jgi:hypothetical protein
MRTIVEKESKYAHVETTFMKKVDIAYDCWSKCNGVSYCHAIEGSCNHDTNPARAITCNNVGNCRQQAAGEEDRPSAIDVREWNHEKRSSSRKEKVHREFIRCLDRCDSERFPQGYERWVNDSRAHRAEQSQKSYLEAYGELEPRGPVLEASLVSYRSSHDNVLACYDIPEGHF